MRGVYKEEERRGSVLGLLDLASVGASRGCDCWVIFVDSCCCWDLGTLSLFSLPLSLSLSLLSLDAQTRVGIFDN